jgi:hypothetical protein
MKYRGIVWLPLLIIIASVALVGIVGYVVVTETDLIVNNNSTKSANVSANNSNTTVVGGDRDAHGCIGSAGYSWCETKQKCLRAWEESCADTNSNTNSAVNANSIINTNIAVIPADWKTYVNTVQSYTLRYPPTWTISELDNVISIGGTSSLNANSNAEDIAFTTPKVEIQTRESLFPSDDCLIGQTNVVVAGAEHIRQTEGCAYAGDTVATYFQRGNAYVVFSWTTDVADQFTTYEQILSTFRLTE